MPAGPLLQQRDHERGSHVECHGVPPRLSLLSGFGQRPPALSHSLSSWLLLPWRRHCESKRYALQRKNLFSLLTCMFFKCPKHFCFIKLPLNVISLTGSQPHSLPQWYLQWGSWTAWGRRVCPVSWREVLLLPAASGAAYYQPCEIQNKLDI